MYYGVTWKLLLMNCFNQGLQSSLGMALALPYDLAGPHVPQGMRHVQ